MQTFELKPFSPGSLNLVLRARVDFSSSTWSITYRVSGSDLSRLKVSSRSVTPTRTNELWKTTCFEAFIQPEHSREYYEMNFAPSGHWNIYQFDDYRQGMREAICPTPPQSEWASATEEAIFTIRVPALIPSPFHFGLSAVIDTGSVSYWALTHASVKPDFHDSKGWTASCSS